MTAQLRSAVDKSKKQPEQKKWKVVIGDEWDYDDGDYYARYGGETFVVKLIEDLTKEELKKKEKNDPWYYPEMRTLFACELSQEDTCCGFPQLGNFETDLNDIPEGEEEKIVKALLDFMTEGNDELKKKGYYSAYIPDTKEYDKVRKVFVLAGFVPGVQLKSNHGNYTNTRWEWFDGKKVDCPLDKKHVENILKKAKK